MRKKNLIPLLLLTLSGCTLTSESSSEFHRLASAAEPEAKICEAYVAETRAKFSELDGRETFTKKGEALSALRLLEKRPARFPASAEASRYFLAHYPELINSWNLPRNQANLALLGNITQHCEMFQVLRYLPGLLRAQETLNFTRVDALAKAFLFEHRPHDSVGVIPVMVQISVLEKYLELGRALPEEAPLRARAQALSVAAERERAEVLPRNRGRISRIVSTYTGSDMRREMDWRLNLGRRYLAILAEVFPGGA